MLRRLGRALLPLSRRIAKVQVWLLLSGYYFLVLGPVALVLKMWSDPLRLRPHAGSMWHAMPQGDDPLRVAKAQ